MGAWLKWIVGAILLLAVLALGLSWGIYAYGASSLQASMDPNPYRASALIRRQYMQAETGVATELPKLNPVTVWWSLYRASGNGDDGRRRSLRLLGQASRILGNREPAHSSVAHYQAVNAARMAIISREWSLDDVVNTLISESGYGRGATGIESASLGYFGIPLSRLQPEETLALLVLLRGPSRYDPACNRELFENRYAAVAARLKMNPGSTGLHKATLRMLPSPCH